MNRNIERYIPFPLLMWRAITQPFWSLLAVFVDLGLRVYLRSKYGIIDKQVHRGIIQSERSPISATSGLEVRQIAYRPPGGPEAYPPGLTSIIFFLLCFGWGLNLCTPEVGCFLAFPFIHNLAFIIYNFPLTRILWLGDFFMPTIRSLKYERIWKNNHSKNLLAQNKFI